MEEKKFRLRLNLFDGIVLLTALVVGAALLWMMKGPQSVPTGDAPAASTVRYVVRFQRWLEGTGSLIQPGDKLVDNIKNFEMGQVVSTQVVPVEHQLLDHTRHVYGLTTIDGYEDILVTVESPCIVSDDAITVGGGYAVRVGTVAFIKGEGYMASGPIISIEREGQA